MWSIRRWRLFAGFLTVLIASSTLVNTVQAIDEGYYSGNDILWYDDESVNLRGANCNLTYSGGGDALEGNDNLEKIIRYFVGKGFTLEQAAGIAGNIRAESSFNPGAVETTTNPNKGYGIAQWTGSRRTALEKAAKASGVPSNDLGFQLDYLYKEMQQRKPNPRFSRYDSFANEFEALRAQKTVEGALVAFHHNFERSHLLNASNPDQAVVNARGGFAKKYYDKFKSTISTSALPTDSSVPTVFNTGCEHITGGGQASNGGTSGVGSTSGNGNSNGSGNGSSGNGSSNGSGSGTSNGNGSGDTSNGTCSPGGDGWNAMIGCGGGTIPSGSSEFMTGGFVVYNQEDPRWADNPFGTSGKTIHTSGCGPTALATAITALTGKSVTPAETTAYANTKNIYVNGVGASHSIAPILAKHWGLSSKKIGASVAQINAELRAGKLVTMAGTGAAPFTSSGHYIIIRGVTSDGKWMIADSNGTRGQENSRKSWNPNGILGNGRESSIYALGK